MSKYTNSLYKIITITNNLKEIYDYRSSCKLIQCTNGTSNLSVKLPCIVSSDSYIDCNGCVFNPTKRNKEITENAVCLIQKNI